MNWRWVHYNDTPLSSKYYGKLLSWEDFDTFSYEDYGHDCLNSVFCASDDDSAYCKGFKKLDRATRLFLSFEVAALVCVVFWLQHVLYLLMKREYGFVRLNYLWAPLSFVFHTCAFVSYVAVSEVSFEANCDFDSDSAQLYFCAEQGPQFIMWSMICLTFGALFSDLIYLRRYVRGVLSKLDKSFKAVGYMSHARKHDFDSDTSLNVTGHDTTNLPSPKQLKSSAVAPVVYRSAYLQTELCILCSRLLAPPRLKSVVGVTQLDCGHQVHTECQTDLNCPM
jgi:hypothetical protein